MNNFTKILLALLCMCLCGIIGFCIPLAIKGELSDFFAGVSAQDENIEKVEVAAVPASTFPTDDQLNVNDDTLSQTEILNANPIPATPVEVAPEIYKVRKIDKRELESILNSGDGNRAVQADFKNRVSGKCTFEFEGRDEDEGDAPVSYGDILMRTNLNTWESVTVLDTKYDEMDCLVHARIKVNYSADAEDILTSAEAGM